MHVIDTTLTDITRITVNADGACSGNPGPGGWAAIIIGWNGEAEIFRHEISGGNGDTLTTNNQMELTGPIEAMNWIRGQTNIPPTTPVHVYSDSEYVVKNYLERFPGWLRNGWKKADKKPVKNRDLWTKLHDLAVKMDVTWNWVRGHAGDPLNEAVDALARAAIPKADWLVTT
jgi:ribonuclease HI